MIFDALHWVGLNWDEGPDVGGPYGPYRQSERTEIYREHVQILLDNGQRLQVLLRPPKSSKPCANRRWPPSCPRATTEPTASSHPHQIAAKSKPKAAPSVIRLKVPVEGETSFRDELRSEITFATTTSTTRSC